MIWLEILAFFKPKSLHAVSSTSGSTFANVPIEPEIFPYEITSLASSILFRFLFISSYHNAKTKPKLIGSPCMPWERPIISVSLNSNALFFIVKRTSLISSIIISAESLKVIAIAVSMVSEEVIPKCR